MAFTVRDKWLVESASLETATKKFAFSSFLPQNLSYYFSFLVNFDLGVQTVTLAEAYHWSEVASWISQM